MVSRRAFVVTIAALLLGASWFAWRSRANSAHPDAPHAMTAASDDAMHPPSSVVARPSTTAPPSAGAPADLAATWFVQAEKAIRHHNRKMYGADVGALLDLPPREAYAGLVARWHDGDVAAAIAASLLAQDCRGTSSPTVHWSFSRLPQDWVHYLQSIQRAEDQWREARIDDCVGVGGAEDLDWETLVSERPENLLAQQYKATKLVDDAEAIAALRKLADEEGSDDSAGIAFDVRRDLAVRLINSSILNESLEGQALLEKLGESDEFAIAALLYCYKSGCGSVLPNAEREQFWMQVGAGLGNQFDAVNLNNAAVDANDPISGWAWSAYELQLAEAGCLEWDQPRSTWLRQAAKRAIGWDKQLDQAQRVQAQQALAAILLQWSLRAQEYLGCTLD